jgi:hypothetical protein
MYLSDVTKQIKKQTALINGGIGFLQIVFKGTSNKLLKRKEIESKLYENFPTSGEYQVLSEKTGAKLLTLLVMKLYIYLCVMKHCLFSCKTACRQGGRFTVQLLSARAVSLAVRNN